MQSASDIAEAAIARQEAEEAGIDTSGKDSDKGKQDDDTSKKGDDAAKGKDSDKGGGGDSKDAGKSDDKAAGKRDTDDDGKPSGKKDDGKDADEEGKFTADDALEVDAPKTPDTPTTDQAGVQLSPAEIKHIRDNIGEPLVIKGIVGEGDNAKEVEIKAYSVADIPQNFRFGSDAQRMAAQNGFTSIERKAEQLLGSYRSNQSKEVQADFERRENEGIRADVADLQKEGRMAKFKIQPGAPGFDDDPAAQQMSEVLKVMADRNDTYLRQYNQGRPYKHIGFAEAFDIWERQNPQKQAEKKADDDQKKEDDDRKKVADKVGTGRGLTQSRVVKPTVRSGTTIDDILNAHEAEEW